MLTHWICLDCETIAAPDAEQWLPPVTANRTLKDPEKIAADLAAKKAEQMDGLALDPDLCQIVVIGLDIPTRPTPLMLTGDEAQILRDCWGLMHVQSAPIVGYGLTWFDLGVLVRRSQLLRVPVPEWAYKQGKYRHDRLIELSDYLTLNGLIDQKKGRGLEYHCRRFGIEIADTITGADVGRAWADGHQDLVIDHCRADLARVKGVAQALGLIELAKEAVA